ncbi:protein PATRONUS 1-like [Alnus glutinosa]|uniref:protein PATRONUS 1-like n=1 Tax=Alnus glutinosa TaxID=3517 RepID=UPI002D795EA7|nr:protein PATRONUS 1-like [Alnus glutinosa]
MGSRFTPGQLIIPNENLDVHHKKDVDGKMKGLKTATKKGGVGLGGRKALNDITNKASLHHEASSRKKDVLPKGELNVAEEMFLHDHKKCIEAQKSALDTFYLDMVLPGHDSLCPAEHQESKQSKADPDSPRCYPEEVELPVSEFADWLASSIEWTSPPSSPIRWDSPPSSPFAWESEAVEFILKQEIGV